MKIDAGERERLSAKIDEWVRTGNGNRARHLLHRLSESGAFHRLPREEAAPIAALARRSGLPMLGLALLTPYVRPSHRRPAEPTPREKAEYAGCLAYVGATGEALEILKTLDAASLPMVYLFRSFAHISRWEYAMAIPYLKLYVRAESLTPYQRLVGRLNLADALVQTGNTLGAGALLRDLLHRASIQRHGNLTGKALEIAAQKFIFQKRWSQAEPLLERAEWLLRDSESLDLFFVRKWKAVISLFRDHRTTRLESVRAEALQRHHWETARDCDRFRAIRRSWSWSISGRRFRRSATA
jgi:hypothetical protein